MTHVGAQGVLDMTAFSSALKGKFKMILKARRTIDDELVCNMDPSDQKGTMRVKPTTFNAAMSIKASVLCPSCSCEMVRFACMSCNVH